MVKMIKAVQMTGLYYLKLVWHYLVAISQFNVWSGAVLYFYLFNYLNSPHKDNLKLSLDFSATYLDSHQFFRVFPFQRMI